MTLFALSDTLGLAIIALVNTVAVAFFAFLTLVVKEYFDRIRAKEVAEQVAQVAVKAEENSGRLEEIHVATNSMKDALVLATEKEALQRGKNEERERANAERKSPEM